MSRHRGVKQPRRCGRSEAINLFNVKLFTLDYIFTLSKQEGSAYDNGLTPDYLVPTISPFRDQSLRGQEGILYAIDGNMNGLTISANFSVSCGEKYKAKPLVFLSKTRTLNLNFSIIAI